jgi:hypothetical protein
MQTSKLMRSSSGFCLFFNFVKSRIWNILPQKLANRLVRFTLGKPKEKKFPQKQFVEEMRKFVEKKNTNPIGQYSIIIVKLNMLP